MDSIRVCSPLTPSCSLTDAFVPVDVSQPWPSSTRDDSVSLTKWVLCVPRLEHFIYIYIISRDYEMKANVASFQSAISGQADPALTLMH